MIELEKKLADLKAKIKVSDGDDISVEDLKKLEKYYGDIYDTKKKDVLIIWDECIQYIGLGLLDLYLTKIFGNDEENIDLDKYFYRDNMIVDAVSFVKYYMKEVYEHDVDDDVISNLYKDNYAFLIKSSPMSNILLPVMRCNQLYSKITFVFRYKFEGMKELVQSIRKEAMVVSGVVILMDTIEEYGTLDNLYNTIGRYHNYLIGVDLGSMYIYIGECKRRFLSLLVPEKHNGLDIGFASSLYKLFKDPTKGLLDSEVIYYKEGLSYN